MKSDPQITSSSNLYSKGIGEEEAFQAFQARPKMTIHLRMTLSFLVFFLLICVLAIPTLLLMSQLGKKQIFLEKTADYALKIQQARRDEHNFFLSRSNLNDALLNVQIANSFLVMNKKDLISVIGEIEYEKMEENLNQYRGKLDLLARLRETAGLTERNRVSEIERDLRTYGAKITADASAAIKQERIEMDKLLSTARTGVILSLVLFLFTVFYFIRMFTRRIIRPLNRVVEHTERVAKGDFTPVRLMGKYRDEFSCLIIGINRLIYEFRACQEQLIQSRKMAAIGNLTAGIAHELNNPLNNISLTTEALLEEFEDYSDEEKNKLLEDIFTQVERAGGTIRNLLDFARVEKPAFTSVSIVKVIDTVIRLVRNEIALNDIELRVNIQKNLPPLIGNARNLQQVFLNLILNSVQAMPNGGTLGVSAAMDTADFLRVDVSDTGVGIPAENLDKIFDPFFTTKEVGKGTGLGLSVTHTIIEGHKGRITVRSKVGEGTTFSVYLPCQGVTVE